MCRVNHARLSKGTAEECAQLIYGRLFSINPGNTQLAWRWSLFPSSTNGMADYFGVEFPSPFDKEYVDPASARTVARLLQEDMSGK